MAVLGLRFCARALSSCGKRGPLLIAVRGPLLLRSTGSRCAGSVIVAHGPSRPAACDPSRPGLEPVSPAPAGRLSTTAPPGKPCLVFYNHFFIKGNCFPSHSMQNVVQLHMNKPLINTSFGIYFLTALLWHNSHTIWFTHLKCAIQWLFVRSQICVAITPADFRIFSSPPEEALYPLG